MVALRINEWEVIRDQPLSIHTLICKKGPSTEVKCVYTAGLELRFFNGLFLFSYTCMCATCIRCPQKPGMVLNPLKVESDACWNPNWGPHQEHQVLLTAESFLQPPNGFIYTHLKVLLLKHLCMQWTRQQEELEQSPQLGATVFFLLCKSNVDF